MKVTTSVAVVAIVCIFSLLCVVTESKSLRLPSQKQHGGNKHEKKPTEEEQEENELKFNPIDIPSPFRTYDANKDGVITLFELAEATDTSLEDARGAFRSADSNDDKKLSYKEFSRAPWIFRADDAIDEDSSSFFEDDLQY
ncbi:uncharacterized protein [Antedon mediterranea]|uniref:uncharacterized protein n=1 Tax=Antedon mediterranea TaxID=105859 RepID=UPI003AF64A87